MYDGAGGGGGTAKSVLKKTALAKKKKKKNEKTRNWRKEKGVVWQRCNNDGAW